MSDFLKKCLERGLTPSNVASYLSLKFLPILGSLWGTLRFRVKALLLGIKAGSGIRAPGQQIGRDAYRRRTAKADELALA